MNKKKERIILHIDANSFYASVECAFNPALKNKPVAVSGNPAKRNGIILAKNEIAKKMGVLTGEAIWQAKEKCADLICLPPRMEIYEEFSRKLQAIYKQYTHLVEPFGIDECWIDITQTQHLFGGARAIAEKIRAEVKEKLKITVSIGISFCKLFAKLGSDLKKPDAITEIPRKRFKEIVYPLPITEIIGIGHRLEKRFHKLNVFKLGDIIHLDDFILKKIFGVVGLNFKQKLLGEDNDPVASSLVDTIPKSVGNGTTTTRDIFTEDEIRATVIFLAEQVAFRLRAQNLLAGRIGVTIKDCFLKNYHHSAVLSTPTQSQKDITLNAMSLINKFWTYNEKVRAVRISVSSLTPATSQQISMFENEKLRQRNLDKTCDFLKAKYGKNIFQPAVLSASPYLREGFPLQRPTPTS